MVNQDTQVARTYHQATKHSPWSVQANRNYLDWNNQPLQFKVYIEGEKISLPRDLVATNYAAIPAIANPGLANREEVFPDLAQVAYLLYYSAGITKKLVYPQGEIAFRAAACAGALYPIEIYLVCGELPGLSAGVYHFSPEDFSLVRLRRGDFRTHLVQASGDDSDVAQAPLSFVYTAITWRSSWKYQARAYRYHYWDCGTILANSLAACSAQQLPAKVGMGFLDEQVNQLIGIDGVEEKSLCLLPVGRAGAQPPAAPELTILNPPVLPLSGEQRPYPLIDEIHLNSRLFDGDEVRAWRESVTPADPVGEFDADRLTRLEPVDFYHAEEGKSLEKVIVRRGSSRHFKKEAISIQELNSMLQAATQGFMYDWPEPSEGFLNRFYLSVHAVDGLPAGKYRYWPEQAGLELLEEGDFRSQAAYLCLGQQLGGAASVTVFFLADLPAILSRSGNRGYRITQMEAGIIGGKLYLTAYALGRGATGLTFFDDEVVRFFSPSAAGLDAIFVTAIGVPATSSHPQGRLVYMAPGRGG